MSLIPEVKCRRCGETFSSLRSRCPNCGTRRVAQSGRTPGTTPGTVKGTASYERAETNTKWQMIFGLILVVAVILAVIVMVSTSLNGLDSGIGSVKVTQPAATPAAPTIEAAPTPSPSPTPAVEKIEIKYYTKVLDSGDNAPTMHVGDEPLPITATVYPVSIQGAKVTWSSGDDSVLQVTPTEDGGCTVTILQAKAGGVKIYAECFGVKGECLFYCLD
ncbi:MAG: hypothetical protein VB039_01215 [Oscillospiraceae bacterium]|nr:hypothetical protein [Oscillospiraceae bacterium]